MDIVGDIYTVRWFTFFTYAGLFSLFLILWRQNLEIKGTKEWAIYTLLIALESALAIDSTVRTSGFSLYMGNVLVVFGYFMLMAGYLNFFRQHVPWNLAWLFLAVYVLYSIGGLFGQVPIVIRIGVPALFISLFLIAASYVIFKHGQKLVGFEKYFIGCWPIVHCILFNARIIASVNLSGDMRLLANNITAILIMLSFILLAAGILFLIASEQRQQLVQLTETDYTTCTLSADTFYARANKMFNVPGTARNSAAFALVNIVNFSSINQTYGHEIGDRTLKKLADILSSSVNQEDLIARTSGDEFSIILFNADAIEAELVFNRISEQVYDARIDIDDKNIKFSVLIAVAICASNSSETIDDLAKRCNQILAELRQGGGQQLAIDDLAAIKHLGDVSPTKSSDAIGRIADGT